jgi:hypothetical protein
MLSMAEHVLHLLGFDVVGTLVLRRRIGRVGVEDSHSPKAHGQMDVPISVKADLPASRSIRKHGLRD